MLPNILYSITAAGSYGRVPGGDLKGEMTLHTLSFNDAGKLTKYEQIVPTNRYTAVHNILYKNMKYAQATWDEPAGKSSFTSF